jgi:2-polyprenyl-6-methoxyphenol hydroxylase-like FAD-dependent oxidoreductase
MAAVRNVLIVGSGIAGQTLACALAKRKIRCEIVELKPDFGMAGTGMTIQGIALRAFLDIGVVGDIADAGWHRDKNPIVFTDTQGDVVFEPPERNLVGPGFPAMVAIRRPALHEVLARAVAKSGVPVRMGTTVERLDDRGTHVDVTLSDGRTGVYDLVVGCDGIHSKVRTLLFGRVQPLYSGFANWRAILPRPARAERMTWMWGNGKTVGILPMGRDQIYVAGVTKEPTAARYPQAELPALFRDRFKGFGGVMADVLPLATNPEQWLYTVMEEIKLPAPWYRGRVVVLGDAAHASCPFWAQGASMAVEDCIVLARLLETPQPIDQVLATWMARRYERCMFVQQGSYDTGVQLHQDPESDAPKVFPPPVREIMAKLAAQRAAKLAEPI